MYFKFNFKKLTSFGLAFLFGLLVVGIFQIVDSYNKAEKFLNNRNEVLKIQERTINFKDLPLKSTDSRNKPLFILTKPRPVYTEQARVNNTQGKVILRVTFLANGEIGAVSPVANLPDGLTEQAVAAAKQIKFEPQINNGNPVTVIKQVQFNFTIY